MLGHHSGLNCLVGHALRGSSLGYQALAYTVIAVLLGVGCVVGYLLLQQGGRVLLRLDALEERLARIEEAGLSRPTPHRGAPPANGAAPSRQGLPFGSPAPEWELPDLSGQQVALSSFRGDWLLLIFFNPGCGYCTAMAPALATLSQGNETGAPIPVVIATGDAEANRALVRKERIRGTVVLQEKMQVASAYGVSGTPMGYLIDPEGKIASDVAVGAEALLALARLSPAERSAAVTNGAAAAEQAPVQRGNRSLQESKINRGGLPPGSVAPAFTLPRLGGGEVSLSDYQGRQLLLVFSDPNCGPCEVLAPQLEAARQERPDLAILMVSRGEDAKHEAKSRHGLAFPVGLQKKWEVSRLYQIFATPVAFLIGEDGRTIGEVAQGPGPVLSLIARTEGPDTNKQAAPNGERRRT
jgi:peroxiredoxin